MITLFVTIGVIILIVLFIAMSYIKAPPDVAYLISGLRKEARAVIGRATIRIPFLERVDKIPLGLIQVDIKTESAVPTTDYINIFVDAVANIKVSSNPELLKRAAQNFLNCDIDDIGTIAQQVLEGNMREIIGQMKLTDLVSQRDAFAAKVQENAIGDMNNMGLEVINLTVQNFSDDNNVIQDLGIDNITKIQKEAQIARAQSERDVKVAQAQADEEGAKARAEADAKIAEQEKILDIKRSEYKKEQDIKKAEADAAYSIQEAEQKKAINEASVQAEIIKTQKLAELKEQEIAIKEKELDANVKKTADASKYKQEKDAEAQKFTKQQSADAKFYEMQKQAEVEMKIAEAEKYKAEQEAEGIKAKLLAEAEGKKAILLAEAEGIEKKAEAQKKMGEASILEMYFNVLPQIAKEVSQPLNQVDKITMYGDGNSTKLVKEMTNNISKVTEVMKDTTGIDVTDILQKFLTSKDNLKNISEDK